MEARWPVSRVGRNAKLEKGGTKREEKEQRERKERSRIASEQYVNSGRPGRQKSQQAWGVQRWSRLDIFSVWSGRGRYLLKGFFQRSKFRAGACRKARRTTGGMCKATAMPD